MFEHWGRELDPEALARACGDVDLDAPSAACPACGASFTPSEKRCAECGLRLG